MDRREMLKRLGLASAALAIGGRVEPMLAAPITAAQNKPNPHWILYGFVHFVSRKEFERNPTDIFIMSDLEGKAPDRYFHAGQKYDRSDKICSICGHDYWDHPIPESVDSWTWPPLIVCQEDEMRWPTSGTYKAGWDRRFAMEKLGYLSHPTRYNNIEEFNRRLRLEPGQTLPWYPSRHA